MGFVKIGQRILGNDIRFKQSSKSAIGNNKQDDGIVLTVDEDDDSDDSEIAETGCEYGMVGDQLCNVPYELYDLPELKEMLSVEAWNSCLNDEDRFFLSAYLPDIDQQTFWFTMTELLSGKNMFFGCPLAEFFSRLKGGLYPPKVNRFREGLQFLQRRAFYHSLRSYHENMVSTCSDMKIAWSKCRSSFSADERIQIWNAWKNQKAKSRVDLNAFPLDNDMLCKSSTRLITGPVARKIKLPPAKSCMPEAPLKTNGKGVLKIKPAGMNSMQTAMVCRPVPKGVLKAYPTVEVSKCTTGQQQMEYLNSTTGVGENFQNAVRKIKWTKDPESDVTGVQEQNLFSENSHSVRYTHNGIGTGKSLTSGNISPNLDQEKINYYHDPGEQKMAPMHEQLMPLYPRSSEAVPRISSSNVGRHQLSSASLDQSNERHRDFNGGCLEKAYD